MKGRDDSDFLNIKDIVPPAFEQTGLASLSGETRPVTPLRRPYERALILLILALGVGAVVLMITRLRTDIGTASPAVTYGPAILELLAGGVAFLLAMRWSVPGEGGVTLRSKVYLGIGLALSLAAALAAPHFVAPGHPSLDVGCSASKGLPCLGWQICIGFPVLLVAIWLVFRGSAAASSLAGALAGLGAGLVTDAAIHLICGAADLAHTVPWHFGGVALMVATGALLGKVLPKW